MTQSKGLRAEDSSGLAAFRGNAVNQMVHNTASFYPLSTLRALAGRQRHLTSNRQCTDSRAVVSEAGHRYA